MNDVKRWLRGWAKKYAESKGFKLGDEKTVDSVLNGLLRNKEKYNFFYCPCRAQKVRENICPCIYHVSEIQKMGRCWCGLFAKPGTKPKGKGDIEEWEKIWEKVDEERG